MKEEFECIKCGFSGIYPGPITFASTCPKCKSIYIIPLNFFDSPVEPTPADKRRRFKLLPGGKP